MAMENMLLRTYSNLENAQQARSAMLAAGIDADRISLTAKEDEAGPVAGNFMIDREFDPDSERKQPDLLAGYDPNEVQSTTPVQWGNSYMLLVAAENEEQLTVAADVAKKFGGIDVDEVVSNGKAALTGE